MKSCEKSLLGITLLATLTLGLLLTNPAVYAQTATPTPTATSSAIADAEIERQRTLLKELSLVLPESTDDPNYTITFVDPSPNKEGVEITVDTKTTTGAKSPFLLQSLSIGQHNLIFKFKNKEGLSRVITQKLMIVPKAPILDSTTKTVINKPAEVVLKGSALPQSNVMIVINSAETHSISVSPEGKWEFIVPEPKSGQNNVIFFTIRDGIVSIPSKSFTYEYKLVASDGTAITTQQATSSLTSFFQTLVANIDYNRRENPGLFYGIIGISLIIVLVLIDLSLRKKAAKKRDEKTIAALFGSVQKEGGSIVDIIQSMQKGNKSKVIEEPPVTPESVKKAIEALKVKLDDAPDEDDEEEKVEAKEEKEITTETPATVISADAPKIIPDSVKESEVKKPETAPKKAFSIFGLFKGKSAKPTVTPVEPVKEEKEAVLPTPDVPEPKAEPAPVKTQKKTSKKTTPKEVESKVEAVSIEEAVETEEPEKKVLTKEEFLKQFQKGSARDE